MNAAELRATRESLHMTMRQLAEALGYSYATVKALETGHRRITERMARAVELLKRERERDATIRLQRWDAWVDGAYRVLWEPTEKHARTRLEARCPGAVIRLAPARDEAGQPIVQDWPYAREQETRP